MIDRPVFLQLRGLGKSFGAIAAVAGLDLDVHEDELLVVLGPTGAGKTTLLRLVAGLEHPETGSISMGGTDVTAHSPADRDTALVFQNFALYPDWSVRRNLAFPLQAPGRGLSPQEIAERVESTAEMLRIAHLLDRRSAMLSGGEMQRVAIGRAIVRRPRIFLLDEPLTNLDAKLRETLRVELVELRRRLGTPMILVTHDQEEALCMGDRIAVLAEGRVLQDGSPEEIYRKPASVAVARQLGQPPINIVPVRLQDGYWVNASGLPLLPASSSEFSHAHLGIRPEDIELEGGELAGTVAVAEDMGPARILLVAWSGQHLHVLTTRTGDFSVGAEVRPRWDPGRTQLWPALKPA